MIKDADSSITYSDFAELLDISTMTLATTDLHGNPHAAPVYFVADDIDQRWHFYFFSDEKSLHSQHIAQNPKTAAAVYPECHDWRDIKGLQMRGKTRLVESNAEWISAWAIYQKKFPFVRSLEAEVAQNQLYVYVPSWIRLVDNSKGFGFKKEWVQ